MQAQPICHANAELSPEGAQTRPSTNLASKRCKQREHRPPRPNTFLSTLPSFYYTDDLPGGQRRMLNEHGAQAQGRNNTDDLRGLTDRACAPQLQCPSPTVARGELTQHATISDAGSWTCLLWLTRWLNYPSLLTLAQPCRPRRRWMATGRRPCCCAARPGACCRPPAAVRAAARPWPRCHRWVAWRGCGAWGCAWRCPARLRSGRQQPHLRVCGAEGWWVWE